MSEEERDNYVSLFTTVAVSIPYFIYIIFRYQNSTLGTTSAELLFWASAILLLIPLRIVAQIVITIIATIISTIATGKEPKSLTDERDKLIDLKGTRNSYYTFCVGFLLAIIALAAGQSVTVMFTIIITSCFFAELVEISSKIYYYQKGC